MTSRHGGRRLGAATLVTLTFLAFGATAGAQPVDTAAEPGLRIWLESGSSTPRLRTSVSVAAPSVFVQGEPVRVECVVESGNRRADCTLKATVTNEAGDAVFEGALPLDLDVGENTRAFEWTPAGLAPGVYTMRVALRHPLDGELGVHTLTLRALTHDAVAERTAGARERLRELDAHLERLAASGYEPPHAVLRARLAADFLKVAEHQLAGGDWLHADVLARYAEHACATAMASLAFEGQSARVTQPVGQPPATAWDFDGPGLRAGDGPGFLVGVAGAADPAVFDELARYGLNWAVVPVPPGEIGAGASARVADVLTAAHAHGVAVTPDLALGALPEVASELEAGLLDVAYGSGRALAEAHIQGAGALLAGRPGILGAVLAEAPRFDFHGPGVREEFIDYVRAQYGAVEALNRIWRSHFLTWDEIVVEREFMLSRPRFVPPYLTLPAYRYDWQRFQHGVELRAFASLRDLTRAETGAASGVAVAPVDLRPESAGAMPDRELLTRAMDFAAAVVEVAAQPGRRASAFPESVMLTAFLHSVAPTQPQLAVRMMLELDANPAVLDQYPVVYAALWNTLVFGADGVAVAVAPGTRSLLDTAASPLARPDALEAVAVARLDANRLARPLAALQDAPADIAILYSAASRIFADGEEQRAEALRSARAMDLDQEDNAYLVSLRNAFEGAAWFGRNVRFISERQCAEGELRDVRVLIVPRMSAITDVTFEAVERYVAEGGVIVRQGRPFPYNERGVTRLDVLGYSPRTWLIRGIDTPTDYVDALDAIEADGLLPPQPRPVDGYGYPLEGVIGRAARTDEALYLYLVNLRDEPVRVFLRDVGQALDLLSQRTREFPHVLQPLEPVLLELPVPEQDAGSPAEPRPHTAELEPVPEEEDTARGARERTLHHARP